MKPRRKWSNKDRETLYDQHKGCCHICKEPIEHERWDLEHVIPLALGGDDDLSNAAPAHRRCHAFKTLADVGRIAKAKRVRRKHIGAKQSARPIPGSRNTPWKRKFNGEVERRT